MKPASPAPLSLHQLSLYNTGRMSPAQIIEAFGARLPLLERLVADITAEKPKSRPQHHLIVGQRGMGKTMLLARIAAELRTNTDLKARFIPLVFAEEQYAVDRLSKFWLNCLDSLADARELSQETEAADSIDDTVDHFIRRSAPPARDDQPYADEVYDAFVKAAQASGQRPVLLVDNLQLVFERLETAQQHSLRELLMRTSAPILIGASPSPPQEQQDYGAAFYDQFKVHYLRPLDEDEMRSLMLHLATTAGRDDVREKVLRYPARLKVLHQLTGGNPRTTLTLFFLYAEDFAPNVFGDLENLLDRVTPLYKARFEELTPQQQVITSAIANHWDPVTSNQLVERTALPASTISAQLDRLEKTGTLQRVELYGETRTGYMIAERFFNIWFLMRSASRRQRREVEFLTRFLENFYEPAERTGIARHMMNEERFSPDRYLWSCAVAKSLTERATADDLTRHSELLALRETEAEARKRMHELIDFNALPPATLAFDDLRKKLIALVPSNSPVTPEEFAEKVLGDRTMFMNGEREKLAARTGKLRAKEIRSVLETIATSLQTDLLTFPQEDVNWFCSRLSRGLLCDKDNSDDWNRAFKQAETDPCILLMIESLPNYFGSRLAEDSLTRIRKAYQPTESSNAENWHLWANVLHYKLAYYDEAEAAYRKALELDAQNVEAWINLGTLLHTNLKNIDQAEYAYKQSITLNPTNPLNWDNIGELLQDKKQFKEAEEAFRKSIDIDPKYFWAWFHLGYLLTTLQRYDEGELAYREAIKIEPAHALARHVLGDVLVELKRYPEAEAAYRDATSLDPAEHLHWGQLGHLLYGLGRYSEAETSYEKAISCNDKVSWLWRNIAKIYSISDRYQEASVAYDTAIRINPDFINAHHSRLYLRRDLMGTVNEARSLLHELKSLPDSEFPDAISLHEVAFAAYDSNWGLTCESMDDALALLETDIEHSDGEAWLHTSAVLIHLNYGPDLITFLDQRGDTAARFRPWMEALKAAVAGDRKALHNIAPEIRGAAESLYDDITERLSKLPENTRRRPLPIVKKQRKSRK